MSSRGGIGESKRYATAQQATGNLGGWDRIMFMCNRVPPV